MQSKKLMVLLNLLHQCSQPIITLAVRGNGCRHAHDAKSVFQIQSFQGLIVFLEQLRIFRHQERVLESRGVVTLAGGIKRVMVLYEISLDSDAIGV